MVKIVLSMRAVYIIAAVFIILLVGVGVYAFNYSGPPSTMGHTIDELHPSCSGLLYSLETDNSWNCISPPVSCTGSRKSLQYDSATKTWICATDTTPYECYWTGWSSPCLCIGIPGQLCDEGIYPFTDVQKYCSNGQVTNTETIYCCHTC